MCTLLLLAAVAYAVWRFRDKLPGFRPSKPPVDEPVVRDRPPRDVQ